MYRTTFAPRMPDRWTESTVKTLMASAYSDQETVAQRLAAQERELAQQRATVSKQVAELQATASLLEPLRQSSSAAHAEYERRLDGLDVEVRAVEQRLTDALDAGRATQQAALDAAVASLHERLDLLDAAVSASSDAAEHSGQVAEQSLSVAQSSTADALARIASVQAGVQQLSERRMRFEAVTFAPPLLAVGATHTRTITWPGSFSKPPSVRAWMDPSLIGKVTLTTSDITTQGCTVVVRATALLTITSGAVTVAGYSWQ